MFIEFQVVFDVTHGERHRVPHFKEKHKMILRMVCPKCGENVQKVVLCNWDSESQEFLYGDIKPGLHYWCHACGDIEQPVHITRSASEERLYQRMHQRASLTEADWKCFEDKILWNGTPEDMERYYRKMDEEHERLNRANKQAYHIIESIPLHEFVSSENSRGRCRWAYLRYLEKMEEEEKRGDHHLAEQEEQSMWD